MTTQTTEQPETPRIKITVEELPAGRARVMAGGGALEHSGQLNLGSERHLLGATGYCRCREAQASDAKLPDPLPEALRLPETKALKQPTTFNPASVDSCRFLFTAADPPLPESINRQSERDLPAGALTFPDGDPATFKSLTLTGLPDLFRLPNLPVPSSRTSLPPTAPATSYERTPDPKPLPEFSHSLPGQHASAPTTSPRFRVAHPDLSPIRLPERTRNLQKQPPLKPPSLPHGWRPLPPTFGAPRRPSPSVSPLRTPNSKLRTRIHCHPP